MKHHGKIASIPPAKNTKERSHAACGVGKIINIPKVIDNQPVTKRSHQQVVDTLKILSDFEYRSGFNWVTNESDGAGIRFYGLPIHFFIKKINERTFITPTGSVLEKLALHEGQFAIGQYFLPTNVNELNKAKLLIENGAKTLGFSVVGWRDLNTAVNLQILSSNALQKKPAIWQAIIIKDPSVIAPLHASSFEKTILSLGIHVTHHATTENLAINVISQSSESIVYKGMVRASQLADFYHDLTDNDFTAIGADVHARFSTNTSSEWARAQPCEFTGSHNGELNSAPANATEMQRELAANKFNGIYPYNELSDSMQFDADIANQMCMKDIPLEEALIRLMPPPCSDDYSPEQNAMLKYYRLERTPYNGPAFVVAGAGGCHIAKLDDVGLRPSHWGIIEDREGNRQLHTASDDYLAAPDGGKIIRKGLLEPGGMIMLTPNGEILHTQAILERINKKYNPSNTDHFQQLLHKTLFPLAAPTLDQASTPSQTPSIGLSDLHRIVYSSGCDHESVTQVIQPMAESGAELTGAMGDDTNPLHTANLPPHLSYFFHQLFAQVSAPPLDSIKERDRFTLHTSLGPTPGLVIGAKQIELQSPVLGVNELAYLEHHQTVKSFILDTSFAIEEGDAGSLLRNAIQTLLRAAEDAASQPQGGVLILSDRFAGPNHALIPDMIAVAAVRKHLENKGLCHKVSIVADSYQISGPHQASALLAVGAKAVYARGAYEIIRTLKYDDLHVKHDNYRAALEKCLLKTMGKMGITDVNNYSNGLFLAALGLDLSPDEKTLTDHPTLANIFPHIYSPLKGVNLNHIAIGVLTRHQHAYDRDNDFTILPYSGYYMPEKNGFSHGYGQKS